MTTLILLVESEKSQSSKHGDAMKHDAEEAAMFNLPGEQESKRIEKYGWPIAGICVLVIIALCIF